MKMYKFHKYTSNFMFVLIILGLASLACNFSTRPFSDEASSTGQPDLMVSEAYASMMLSGACLEEYGPITTKICVANQGDVPAGAFTLEVSDGTRWALPELEVGEVACFNSNVNLSGMAVTVDAANEVAESNEENNTTNIPVPTPPVLCTPVMEVAIPPTETPNPTPAPNVSYRGITFLFDEHWFELAPAETIPAEEDAAIEQWNTPEYYQFTFSGYPLADVFHSPRIMVFPAEVYKAINSDARNIITQLEQFLVDKPADAEYIPFLPIFNAGQFMRAQVEYIDFQNGSGVRFLTQYGQAAWPINNQDMFYTFQGLTNDRQYYISAIFPVSHPNLPHPDSVTMDDDFYDNFMDYVDGVEEELNTQLGKDFSPPLLVLDDMMRSLSVVGGN